MPNKKSQRCSLTRELKYTGLPLPIRARLAKLSVRGDSYLICDTLLKSGATVIKSWGCEYCDPYSGKLWEYRGKHFRTEFGQLDRRLTEMAQQRQKENKAPGVPLGQLLASRAEEKPTPFPIDQTKKTIAPKVCDAYNPTGFCVGEPICTFCGV
jgi:hypothetical protein